MVRRTVAGALLALGLATPAAATTTPGPELVDLGGTPVEGGTAPEPTELTAGQWSGTLTGPGENPANTAWFSYRRVMAESTVLLGLVATSPEESTDQVQVEVRTKEGESCGSPVSTYPGQVTGAPFGVLKAVAPDADGASNVCSAASEVVLAVSRGSTSGLTSTLPYVLRVVEEAPVSRDRGDPPPDAIVPVFPDVTDDPEPRLVPGSASFSDAPEIEAGTLRDTVPGGTTRLWRVRLGWGQSLSVRAEVAPQTDDTVAGDPAVELTFFDPLHHGFEGGASDAVDTGYFGPEGDTLLDATPPVGYLNRFDSQATTVPGDYFVAVSADTIADGPPVSVPVELTVGIGGEVAGPPGFVKDVTGPGGDPGPEDYDAAKPYLVGDGVYAADLSGTPPGPGDQAAADDADPAVRRTIGLAVGGASLLTLLAGALLLGRRARVSRPAAR